MEYTVFDPLYDAVFVLDNDGLVVYCNEPAARVCEASIKRLVGKKKFFEVLGFSDFDVNKLRDLTEASPWIEMGYSVLGKERHGKMQMAVQPFMRDEQKGYVITLHDVTLEETLHRKYQGELLQKEDVIAQLREAQGRLEQYSKNLEKMVEERTEELRSVNKILQAIMESLGQGFLVFSDNGECSPIFTKACLDVLETSPAEKPIWDVLKLNSEAEQKQMKKWLQACFSEALPFESMKDLAPANFHHSAGRHITLEYFPLRNEKQNISNVVLVATDKTDEKRALEALENEKAHASMTLKVFSYKEQFNQFLNSTKNLIQKIESISNERSANGNKESLYRWLHTLEGEAGTFSIEPLRLVARKFQDFLMQYPDGQWPTGQFKNEIEGLRSCLDQFSQDNEVLFSLAKIGRGRFYEYDEHYLRSVINEAAGVSSVRQAVFFLESRILRQPLADQLGHYNAIIQSAADKLGKKVKPLRFEGLDFRVDPDLYQALIASLVHAFRNAVDHGIELPEQRIEGGKDAAGEIVVRAVADRSRNSLRLEIQDDGGGIDVSRISQKACEMFPDVSLEGMREQDILQLIFRPGFSSKDEVSEFSGRGIGMDAINSEVQAVGGKVWVESQIGHGSRLIIEIPLEMEERPVKRAS